MLKLYRRGRTWFIRGTTGPTDSRQVVHESTGTDQRDLAEAVKAKREREIYTAAVYGERAVMLFSDAVDSFLEARPGISKGDARRVGRLLEHFGATKLSAIGQAEADKAAAALVGPEATPATKLRAVVAPLSAILMHAARRGGCARPMLERPEPAAKRTDWLTPAQAEALIAAAVEHMRPLLVFLLGTGARVGEALALPWSDVDLSAGVATFRNTEDRRTKSGRDRTVHLPPTVIVALGNLPHREGAVFRVQATERMRATNSIPPPYQGKSGQMKTAWRGTCRRAGLLDAEGAPLVSPHALRHTFATWFYSATRDPLRLMHAGGWSDLKLVERYAHLMPSDLAPQIARVWGVASPDEFPAAVKARAPAPPATEARTA